jgi:hypothetical protein
MVQVGPLALWSRYGTYTDTFYVCKVLSPTMSCLKNFPEQRIALDGGVVQSPIGSICAMGSHPVMEIHR